MFKVDDIPDHVLRDIAGAYHRRLASTDTENQPADERDFQRACYLRTALEWLALWLNQQPVAPAAQAVARNVGDSFFESWYSLYNPEGKSTKQTMREAYEAGMVDHEGRCAPEAQAVADDVVRDVRLVAVWDWCRLTAQDFGSGNARQQAVAKAYLGIAHHIKSKYFRGCKDRDMFALLAAQQQKAGGE